MYTQTVRTLNGTLTPTAQFDVRGKKKNEVYYRPLYGVGDVRLDDFPMTYVNATIVVIEYRPGCFMMVVSREQELNARISYTKLSAQNTWQNNVDIAARVFPVTAKKLLQTSMPIEFFDEHWAWIEHENPVFVTKEKRQPKQKRFDIWQTLGELAFTKGTAFKQLFVSTIAAGTASFANYVFAPSVYVTAGIFSSVILLGNVNTPIQMTQHVFGQMTSGFKLDPWRHDLYGPRRIHTKPWGSMLWKSNLPWQVLVLRNSAMFALHTDTDIEQFTMNHIDFAAFVALINDKNKELQWTVLHTDAANKTGWHMLTSIPDVTTDERAAMLIVHCVGGKAVISASFGPLDNATERWMACSGFLVRKVDARHPVNNKIDRADYNGHAILTVRNLDIVNTIGAHSVIKTHLLFYVAFRKDSASTIFVTWFLWKLPVGATTYTTTETVAHTVIRDFPARNGVCNSAMFSQVLSNKATFLCNLHSDGRITKSAMLFLPLPFRVR